MAKKLLLEGQKTLISRFNRIAEVTKNSVSFLVYKDEEVGDHELVSDGLVCQAVQLRVI